jgi:hypothetical protein
MVSVHRCGIRSLGIMNLTNAIQRVSDKCVLCTCRMIDCLVSSLCRPPVVFLVINCSLDMFQHSSGRGSLSLSVVLDTLQRRRSSSIEV